MNASPMHRPLPKITGITMHVLTPMTGFLEYRHIKMRPAEAPLNEKRSQPSIYS